LPILPESPRDPPGAGRARNPDMARVHRQIFQGKPIVHLDLSNLKPGEFKPVFAEAMSILAAAPLGSVRIVTDVEGARFDPATIVEFEAFVREATPRCLANAIVGVTGIRRVAWLGLKPFYKCPAELSDTLEKGKAWVAAYGG
jgi:hypothetical protein